MTKELSYIVRAEPGETTSHSTRLSKHDSQVAGYVEAFFIEAKATFRQAQGERMIVNE